jgi:hypothetical protein
MACHEDVTFRLIGIFPDSDFSCLIFFLELPLMKRAKRVPRIDSFFQRKSNHVRKRSSGPQLCIQHLAGYFMGTEPLAKPKSSLICPASLATVSPIKRDGAGWQSRPPNRQVSAGQLFRVQALHKVSS